MEIELQEIKGDKNLKGINLEYWGGLEGFLNATSDGSGGSTSAQMLKRVVPWLAKATTMTANAVSDLPFDILDENQKVIDSSTDWKNKIGGLPNPGTLFYLLASSLCLGKAYAAVKRTKKILVDIQYFAPHTITPFINANGLQHFDRATDTGKAEKYFPYDKETDPILLYFWLPDSDIELGPAKSYPAGTALLSCKLLFSMDGSLQTNADRGFIPPTILSAKGMPSEPERQKTESWFNRFLKGFTKEPAKIINAEAMSINKLGGGMDELKGIYGEINKQAIENIGTAFGIPAALFMSDMAFASEVNPLIKVWYTTSQFKLIYQTIETTFSEQLLNSFGLKLKFKPETLDAFKDDQLNNAQAFGAYCDQGIKPSISAVMAGLKLPDGIKPEDLDPEEKELVQPVIEKPVEKPEVEEPKSLTTKQIKELALWNQIATRCFKKNKGKAIDFECKDLSNEMASEIRTKLQQAKSLSDISKSFEFGETKHSEYEGLKELADAINNAVK
jgi:hypothetical protein